MASAAQIQWGLMAFVFGLSHLGYLLTMPAVAGSTADGRSLVLFVVFVTEMSDVLQYVWGKLLGRHKHPAHGEPQQDLGGVRGRRGEHGAAEPGRALPHPVLGGRDHRRHACW